MSGQGAEARARLRLVSASPIILPACSRCGADLRATGVPASTPLQDLLGNSAQGAARALAAVGPGTWGWRLLWASDGGVWAANQPAAVVAGGRREPGGMAAVFCMWKSLQLEKAPLPAHFQLRAGAGLPAVCLTLLLQERQQQLDSGGAGQREAVAALGEQVAASLRTTSVLPTSALLLAVLFAAQHRGALITAAAGGKRQPNGLASAWGTTPALAAAGMEWLADELEQRGAAEEQQYAAEERRAC